MYDLFLLLPDYCIICFPGFPVQGRSWEIHHPRRVHPHDQGHHRSDGQSRGSRELGSAGRCDIHCQPEPQSHLRHVDHLQGVYPPSHTHMPTYTNTPHLMLINSTVVIHKRLKPNKMCLYTQMIMLAQILHVRSMLFDRFLNVILH